MEAKRITLSRFDEVRILASRLSIADYVGMLTPYLREQLPEGGEFYISQASQPRTFTYIKGEGGEYIFNESGGRIPLSKGRSLTGVIMDKLTDNEFSRTYREMKESYSNFLKGIE